MFKSTNKGFTVAEVMICVAVVGLMAVFLIPKVLHSNSNHKYETLIKESFIQIGEAYLTSKTDPNTPDEDLSSDTTQNIRFYNYLSEHLNYRSRFNTASNTELCNNSRNYFVLPLGTTIKRICTTIAVPRNLRVAICVPSASVNCETSSTITYWLVFPEGKLTTTRGDYTTEYGAGLNGTCTDADRTLHMNGC